MVENNEVIKVEKDGHIAKVILCNPKKLNSMGTEFIPDLVKAFADVNDDEEIRAVILLAEGKTFCAGLDLMAMVSVETFLSTIPSPTADKPKILKFVRKFQDAITSAENCVKPVICAINGWCIGGGLDLAAACDIRLASADAMFSLREARVAIMADLGSLQRLPRIIGEGYTRQLAYTAEDIDAKKANEIGLVNEVYESVESLHEAAYKMAKTIAANAPLCVQASKEVMNYGRGRTIADSLEYVAARNQALLPSEDLFEAVTAFAQKRPADFKGK